MTDDPLQPLRVMFRRRCETDRRTILDLVGAGAETAGGDLHRILHGLSGLAGSFGHGEISRLARTAEVSLTRGQGLPIDILDRLCILLADASLDPE